MNLNDAYRSVCTALEPVYDQREAANIANLVIEKLTGMNRQQRLVNREQHIAPAQQAVLEDHISQLVQHRPVQYVLGEAWFYRMPFLVNENVLIPRPETEELVGWIIKDEEKLAVGGKGRPLMLDIGTGSGCIAIALKKNIPDAEVHAVDTSEKALSIARSNAMQQRTPVQFLHLDFLNPAESSQLARYHIIVSNPPYIPQKDKSEMHPNVLDHEPHTALFVENDDPLLFYSAIATFGTTHLLPGGTIYAEIHENMGDAVRRLFVKQGYPQVEVRKDMQGKDRMVKAIKNS